MYRDVSRGAAGTARRRGTKETKRSRDNNDEIAARSAPRSLKRSTQVLAAAGKSPSAHGFGQIHRGVFHGSIRFPQDRPGARPKPLADMINTTRKPPKLPPS